MKMFEVKDYGIISENHSALWSMCVNMPQIRELNIGEGCWGEFVSCGMKSNLYILRVADAVVGATV